MSGVFFKQLVRETALAVSSRQGVFHSLVFFMIILVFFPLTLPADPKLLRQVAPGIIWTALLFAFFLSAERLYQQDYDDGVIEQWLVSGYPLHRIVTAKLCVHWLANIVPMLVLSPLVAVLFGLNYFETYVLAFSLLLGSPAVFFLCAFAATFTIGLKQKGMLSALILFPLTIPVMIFGSGALIGAMHGMAIQGFFALLLAFSLLACACIPFAIAMLVRVLACR